VDSEVSLVETIPDHVAAGESNASKISSGFHQNISLKISVKY
jgi:hypothetical protein